MDYTIDGIVENLATRRSECVESIQRGNYTPLLRLLEFPYEVAIAEIDPAFEKAGLKEERKLISLQRLVGFALNKGGGYWADLAAGWLEAGLEPDAALAEEVNEMINSKRNSQAARHLAFRAVHRWKKSQQEKVR